MVFDNASDQTYSGVISGTGSVTAAGPSDTLTLSGQNTYSGATTIGVIESNGYSISDGTLQLGDGTANVPLSQTIIDNGSLIIVNPTAETYSGIISGSGIVTKEGSGVLTLLGVNTYTGGTNIEGGTLQLGVSNALPTVGPLGMNTAGGVTLDLNGCNQTIAGLCGSDGGGGSITLGSGTLTVDSGWYAGQISGTGGVLDVEGFFVLDGACTYTGGTTVGASGYLEFDNSNVMPSGGALTIAAGGVVDMYATQQPFGTITGSGITDSSDGDLPAPPAIMMALANYTATEITVPSLLPSNTVALEERYDSITNNPQARPAVRGEMALAYRRSVQTLLNDNGMGISNWTIYWGDGSAPESVAASSLSNGSWVDQIRRRQALYTITVVATSMDGSYAGTADCWASHTGAMNKQTRISRATRLRPVRRRNGE